MEKEFNVTGSCNPAQHYMVDTSRQFAKTTKLVGQGEYFIINRPRQYGKTTMLTALFRALCPEHLVGYLSFEGIGDSIFTDEKRFSQGFVEMLADSLRMSDVQASDALLAGRDGVGNLKTLSKFLVEFIGGQAKSVILLIDEVDKASNSQLFLSFLGMLREQYLARDKFAAPAFQSVVLAGIHDI